MAGLGPLRRRDAVGQARERDDRLHGGAGRIFALERAIEQRLVDVLVERLELRLGEAAAEGVRIEARRRHHRDDVAVVRIDGDHRAAPADESLLGDQLRGQVDAGDDVAARDRLDLLQLGRERALSLHRAAGGVHEDLARAVAAVQLLFVGGFEPELADQRGAGVLAELVVLLELLDVVFADRGHVAERVHGVFAVRIETRQARRDVHARKFEAMHGEARDFLVGEAQPDRHALEAAARAHQLARFVEIVGRQHADLDEALERGVDVGHALAHQFELEGGAVLRQHRAIAIEDQAALRGQRLDAHAIALRQLGVVVVAHHLQHHQPADQHQRQRDDDERGRQRAALEQPLLAPVILDADGSHVRLRIS